MNTLELVVFTDPDSERRDIVLLGPAKITQTIMYVPAVDKDRKPLQL